jgi:hypothetical protein
MSTTKKDARDRVAEFLRQWRLAKSNDQRCIYGIFSDPDAEMAELLTADLQALIEQPEPEYEYAHMNIDAQFADDERFDTLEQAAREIVMWTRPARWKIVRRPKPQPWEDVQ